MAMASYKVRIIANACLTRYDSGETPVESVVGSYSLPEEDAALVLAQIYVKRPELVKGTSDV
ncbi:hypothetical protein D3C81_1117450 [compost metagenome]